MTEQAEALIGALSTGKDAMGLNQTRHIVLDWLAGQGVLILDRLSEWDGDEVSADLVGICAQNAADIAHRDSGHIGPLDMCEPLCRELAEAGAY